MIGKKYCINRKNVGVKCASNEVSLHVVLGKNVIIGKKVKISHHVKIGDNSYINYESIIDADCQIGKFCSIGPQVYIGPGNHPLSYVSTHPFLYDNVWANQFNCSAETVHASRKDTIIGNDVWIGTRAIILAGVSVSDGSIIGAGAVVTKDVPPYAIVAGIPAKIIGYRFEAQKRDKLQQSKWWDWEDSTIKNSYHSFYDIDQFLKE